MGVYPAGTRQKASMSYLDAGGERSSFSMFAPVITPENAEDQAALFATLLTTSQALVLGARIKDTYVDQTTYAVARPTNGAAREVALKIIFRSAATGQTWESYLPTLNIGLISYDPNYGAKDVVLMTTTAVANFKAALDAMPPKNPYVAAYDDNGVTVGMQVVRGFK